MSGDKYLNQESDDNLPSQFREAIREFKEWSEKKSDAEQEANKITNTLYHYTNGLGLTGIFDSKSIWFTDYRHLNDPTEIEHGIEITRKVIKDLQKVATEREQRFLEFHYKIFVSENFKALAFFIGSFSRDPDNLSQWRAYADNGRGYAIGFSESLFSSGDAPSEKANENVFVAPVIYCPNELMALQRCAIQKAMKILFKAIDLNSEPSTDSHNKNFFKQISKSLIASPLIWNCLKAKHCAYSQEKEVRLIMLGETKNFSEYVKTRLRGSEIVPYTSYCHKGNLLDHIAEIIVGPSSHRQAELTVETFLKSRKANPNIKILRSEIPYRAG